MVLLLPILVPLVGGIFVFRQKNEQIRNRMALTVILATAFWHWRYACCRSGGWCC